MGEEWREVTLVEGTNGGQITRIGKQRWSRWLIANPPNQKPRRISGKGWRNVRWRARAILQLAERVEDFRITQNRRDVPINIVNEGKAAVTSYLFAVHGWSFEELTEMQGISFNTVRQYVIAVKKDRR
ncbi:hypothetical protein [Halovenus salina]|uniref:hypothetical protein n=1 Tax=Halovenus salina TaxID=1510225 RepID=UPI002260C307|nr:hypothetical protein [Halovenus salina]